MVSISNSLIRIKVDSREGGHICDVHRYTWENFSYRYVPEDHCVAREKIGKKIFCRQDKIIKCNNAISGRSSSVNLLHLLQKQ